MDEPMTLESMGYNSTWTFTDAHNIIEGLTAVDGYDEEMILAVISGMSYDLFKVLDEKPGLIDNNYFTHDWHWKLRRARNEAKNFFEVIEPWHP